MISRASTSLFLCRSAERMHCMKTETTRINDIEMFYEIDGSGDRCSFARRRWLPRRLGVRGSRRVLARLRSHPPDARGHGRSTNPQRTITHRQCALDTIALLDHLGIDRCKAIGLSMGGNILLHMATMQPDLIEAMVVVSATMHFPEQARAIMRQVLVENQPRQVWEAMRKRHRLGDDQIVALWEWQRGMKDSYDDMNFTPAALGQIKAATLIIYGDRDFLYPVEIAVEIYRAIPRSALWVVPNGGHGPVFLDAASRFVKRPRPS